MCQLCQQGFTLQHAKITGAGYADGYQASASEFTPHAITGLGFAAASYSAQSTIGVARTWIQDIDALLGGVKWGSNTLTYSFPTAANQYEYGGEAGSGFQTLNASQQAAAKAVFAEVSSYTNLVFQEITETTATHANIRLAQSDLPQTAWAYYPSTAPQGGDVWFNRSGGDYSDPAAGNYAHATFLHEIGHALGLKHGHDASGFGALPFAKNSMEYSVMTYASYVGASVSGGYTNETNSFAQTLMMNDIAALQKLYGANFTSNAGDTVYSWSASTGQQFINGASQDATAGNKVFMTVWDGGGNDTYDFSNYTTNLLVDLTPGKWTTVSTAQLAQLSWDGKHAAVGNIANALLHNNDARSLIENANGGGGNDRITGNSAANTLRGGGGNDILDGGLGNDILMGGAGADTLTGGLGYDTISFANAASAVSVDLMLGGRAGDALGDRYLGIESVVGSTFADTIVGSTLAERLEGGNGNDHLFGRGGADTLIGGAGSDTFVSGTPLQGRVTILDFQSGVDKLHISGLALGNVLAKGALTASKLVVGTAAQHNYGEFVFNPTAHTLSWDADGRGFRAPVVIDVLTTTNTLVASDIIII